MFRIFSICFNNTYQSYIIFIYKYIFKLKNNKNVKVAFYMRKPPKEKITLLPASVDTETIQTIDRNMELSYLKSEQ